MVTHCLCHEVSLERLKRLAESLGPMPPDEVLATLKRQTGCCTGCGLCEPYVRLMLRTGRTCLPVLSPAESDRLMREPVRGREAGAG